MIWMALSAAAGVFAAVYMVSALREIDNKMVWGKLLISIISAMVSGGALYLAIIDILKNLMSP